MGNSEQANSVHCHQYVWAFVPEELANGYRGTRRVWEISQRVQQVANSTKVFSVWSYRSGNEQANGATDVTDHWPCPKELKKGNPTGGSLQLTFPTGGVGSISFYPTLALAQKANTTKLL